MESEKHFGDWTVVALSGVKWLCRCICGTERMVFRRDLRAGRSKGCGCKRAEALRAAAQEANTTHGLTKTPEFIIWTEMVRRCEKQHRLDYPRHGGRGVEVCQSWRDSFESFVRDMGRRPSEDAIIHRLDKSGPYSPGNCVWSTRKAQGLNNRSNRMVVYRGEEMPLVAAARAAGIGYGTVCNRVNTLGWSVARALSEPVRVQHRSR